MDREERLERVSADGFWTPDDVECVERSEIIYTISEDRGPLYNSVPFVRASSVEQSKALVQEVFEAHGGDEAASQWMLSSKAIQAPGLVDALVARGYGRGKEHATRVVDVASWDGPSASVEGYAVKRVESLGDLIAFYEAMRKAFGGLKWEPEKSDLKHELALCSGPDARIRRFVVLRDVTQEPVAAAAMTLSVALECGLLWGGGTIPGARGKGIYSALVARRVEEARAMNLRWVGVFAQADTSSAILDKRGFQQVGSMVYYEK